MNKHLQGISDGIQQNDKLTAEQKELLLKSLKNADKEMEIANFKLDRTEKVKRTTAILLEETIAELEQKRKAVEAQNRELEIEAALEKVRSCSLAMYKSEELQDVVNVVFERLNALNIDMNVASIFIFKEGSKDVEQWVASADTNYSTHFRIPYTDNAIFNDLEEAKKNGKDFYNIIYTKELKNEWFNYAFMHTEYTRIPEVRKKYLIESEFYNVAFALSKNTGLQLAKYAGNNFTRKDNDILIRFSKVFEQAYVRFLDLQKAEAQAREAQIEAALERIRSKAMAMQNSSDLNYLISSLFEECTRLEFVLDRCIVMIIDPLTLDSRWVLSNPETPGEPSSHFVQYHSYPEYLVGIEAWKARKEKWSYVLEGDGKKQWDRFLFSETELSRLPEPAKNGMRAYTSILINSSYGNFGNITLASVVPLSDSQWDILIRFTRVFDITYTRFNDLKTAEAQTREAQIELGLERVRARAMAMHQSNELPELIDMLFKELTKLGFFLDRCIVMIMDEATNDSVWWVSQASTGLFVKYKSFKPFEEYLKEWRARTSKWFYRLGGEEKKEWGDYLFFDTELAFLPEAVKTGMHSLEDIYLNVSFSSFGSLTCSTFEPLPEKEFDILMRFAKVFNQTYTRFLDLQKAEAQARESQIQLALERARAQSMIMQHSTELDDTLRVFHEQVLQLDIPSAFSFLWLPDEDKEKHIFWAAWAENNSFKSKAINYPLDRNEPATAQCLVDWKSNQPVVAYHVPPTGVENYFAAWSELIAGVEELKPEYFSNGLYYVEAFMKFGCFGVMVKNPLSEDEKEILERFAIEFERAYRRFLDLQKAEEQARESQVQLALERVRARTMAMQKSDELREVVFTMYEQLQQLNFKYGACTITIMDQQSGDMDWWMAGFDKLQYLESYHVNYFDHPGYIEQLSHWKNGERYAAIEISGAEKKTYDHIIFSQTDFKKLPDESIKIMTQLPTVVFSMAYMKYGALSWGPDSISAEHAIILQRFAKVFEQTYTRFLDLQKAEEQARESQIQLALERVRARTMAMQRSEELMEAANLLFQQVRSLDIPVWSCGYNIWEKGEKECIGWMSTQGAIQPSFRIPLTEHRTFIRMNESRKNAESFYVEEVSGEELKDHYRYMFSLPDFREIATKQVQDGFPLPESQINHVFNFKHGNLIFLSTKAIAESWDIFKRFTSVFEQTYTRFLDLQKAEAQAREAKIEVALEKVRSRTMAMHKSEELGEAAVLLYKELRSLGVTHFVNCGYVEIDEENNSQYGWMTKTDGTLLEGYTIPLVGDEVLQLRYDAWKRKDAIFYQEVGGDKLKNHTEYTSQHLGSKEVDEMVKNEFPDTTIYYCGNFSHGYLHVITGTLLNTEEETLLIRFTRVFEMTYKRFLDLQKAEAQAREAQIETSLERVRSRSMAMHKSDELKEAGELLWNELGKLGIESLSSGYVLMDKEEKIGWTYAPNPATGKIAEPLGCLYTATKEMRAVLSAWKKQEPVSVIEMDEPETIAHQTFIAEQALNLDRTVSRWITAEQLIALSPKRLFLHNFNFKQGSLMIVGGNRLSDEQKTLMLRFTKVFQQTYTRFLDLQKAETSARESQIEAALERVRSRSMGMQKSEELKEVIQIVYDQFVHLHIHIEHTGFIMDYKERNDMHIWLADRHEVPSEVTIPYFDCQHWNSFIEAKATGKDFFANHLNFDEKNKFYNDLFKLFHVPGETKEYYLSCPGLAISTVLLDNVGLYIENFSGIPYSDEENSVLMRFGKVFQQTYTRFIDLKKAETQALEAIKQASVDRVRAEIASMRTTHDLERITPLIWNELTTLGVQFTRCGVFIMDEEKQEVQTMLSTPDGKAIATLHVPFDFHLAVIRNGIQYWRSKEVYNEYWDRNAFRESWSRLASLRGTVIDASHADDSPENLYLHLLPFLQGMLYVGNGAPLQENELNLVQNLAEAFSTAYARYEDFNKLEAAKKQVDSTLNVLQATQKQLIQSEKMASLGELTAGIAHEIQNPLNFVNNFSEVNKELLAELNEEIEKGNYAEVKVIAADIAGNEEKISHHGKRADSIVKGMLQHSRSTSTVKEPVDINSLADEYLRLAYHGLRAKDKSFNATMKTDYDELIGKINIIPQDIGRVILNVITNAFYTVNEKKKTQSNGYEPTVSLNTKKTTNGIEIRVSDNGNGMPPKVVDKIFQPFFTTKPTGQGTGLGLSLAYDIIKAHGGEIKVTTKEGEGSEFIIQLAAPLNS